MSKLIRKIGLISALVIASFCFIVGSLTIRPVLAETPIVVTLENGASIRYADPNGIRFKTTVSEKVDGYTYGTFIIPKSILGNNELNENTENALNMVANSWHSDGLTFTTVMHGADVDGETTSFPKGKYTELLVARSYAEKDGVYTLSITVERSVAGVAHALIVKDQTAPTEEKLGESELNYLYGIIDEVITNQGGFAFTESVVKVEESIDLNTLLTNSALKPVWSVSGSSVEVVDGIVTVVGSGESTVTASVNTQNGVVSASIVVKAGIETVAGELTNAVNGNAKVELYNANGEYLNAITTTVTDGAYSFEMDSEDYALVKSAIISQGENACFIDDYTETKNGVLANAKYRVGNATLNGKTLNSTVNNYSLAKASVSGEIVYNATATEGYGLIMPATATSDNYKFTAQTVKGNRIQSEAGVGITDGEWVLSFQRNSSSTAIFGNANGLYGTRIIVRFEKLGTKTSYDFIVLCGYWNGNNSDTAYFGGRSEYGNWHTDDYFQNQGGNTVTGNCYGNAIWTVEKTDDSIQLYADPITTNTGLQRKLVLTVTADGITLANSKFASDSYNRLFKTDYGTFEEGSNTIIKNGLKGFFGEGVENAMVLMSDGSTSGSKTTYRNISVNSITALKGKVEGATSNATISLYDENGTFVKTVSNAFDDNGNYALTTAVGVYNLIVKEDGKLAFIDAGTTDGVMAYGNTYATATINGTEVASTVNNTTYAEIKANKNATIVPSTLSKKVIVDNSITNGDYKYVVGVNTTTSGPKNTNGNSIGITSGEYSILFVRYAPRKMQIYVYKGYTSIANITFSDFGNKDDTSCFTVSGTGILGRISDGSGTLISYGFEKKGDALYISFGTDGKDLYQILKVTANGIEASDGSISYDTEDNSYTFSMNDTQKANLNTKLGSLYNTTNAELKTAFASFFNAENAITFVSGTANTPFKVAKIA